MVDQARAQTVDFRILSEIREGRESALGELYDRYSPSLYAVALRILSRREDAEEVLQDAWVRVWRRASEYRLDRGTVRAWLHTIVRSRALDRYRSVQSRRRAEAKAAADGSHVETSEDTPQAQSDERDYVARFLELLSSDQRAILECAYFEGLSQSEIAEKLRLPLGTVKTWMRRGLGILRDAAEQRSGRSAGVDSTSSPVRKKS
ncbi:MAG: sigma-70 family RNA polymerase sigma factor [Planctomycetota bacterium]